MFWECEVHRGCMWSLDCSCTNCILYTKTYIDKNLSHKNLSHKNLSQKKLSQKTLSQKTLSQKKLTSNEKQNKIFQKNYRNK